MPNQLSPAKKRVTYTEFSDVFESLDKHAKKIRVDRSMVLRNATQSFVSEYKAKKWKPAPYKSASKGGIRRITYAEWNDIYEVMAAYAQTERLDFSDLMRSVVHTYLCKSKNYQIT